MINLNKSLFSAAIAIICFSLGYPVSTSAKKRIVKIEDIPVAVEMPAPTSRQAGGNYFCYPWLHETPPALTPAPEGYEPFHMEHYSRHGSRWLIGNEQYDTAFRLLDSAHRNGQLTELGDEVYHTVSSIRDASEKRDGDLTDVGALQHQGIGRRMVNNFPEIFNSDCHIDAKSTIVIRSILSMLNGLKGIQSLVPDANITTDASRAEMYYMNFDDGERWDILHQKEATILKEFAERHPNKGEYLKKIIKDPQFARDSIGDQLFNPLFSVLVNTQSHSDQPWLLDSVFSNEEIRNRWLYRNARWFVQSGNSQLTDHKMPYTQANLLRNIIASADTAINSTCRSANLRYGHDTIIMPLSALLEIDCYGNEINDLEMLDKMGWHEYNAIPMAANIQIVFYRKPGDLNPKNVLLKVLLNEKEMTLPFGRDSGPYYRWTDFRNYYLNKIAGK